MKAKEIFRRVFNKNTNDFQEEDVFFSGSLGWNEVVFKHDNEQISILLSDEGELYDENDCFICFLSDLTQFTNFNEYNVCQDCNDTGEVRETIYDNDAPLECLRYQCTCENKPFAI